MHDIYTDGACSGNPGPGGWAYALAHNTRHRGAGSERHTTNQRMEIKAAIEAIRSLDGQPEPIVVHTDSRYVVDCFQKRWHVGWVRNGWKNAKGQPVANQDLWTELLDVIGRRDTPVTFMWVKGHSGNPMNDLVDRMAVEACRTQHNTGAPR